MSLSFVHVQPGKRATAASKHEERAGIHSHAQKVTQQRKRDKRIRDLRQNPQKCTTSSARASPDRQYLVQRLVDQHDVGTLINAVKTRPHHPYGLPTPSPEPYIEIARPLTTYAVWSQDHKYGVSMFMHVTVLDINENSTNMTFWKQDVPALSDTWSCVRDIVSAIAAANQAVQDHDNDLIMTALELHLKALAGLRKDVGMLPLSVQVACCLLFDVFNLLRCEFAIAGDQIAVARRLTSNLQLDAYLQDDRLPTVCDALSRMDQTSAWSFWNPSNFLRYERLQHVESNLHVELPGIDSSKDELQGLVDSMGRFSRSLSGRIRRNLSRHAFIDPSSRFALDTLQEFKKWQSRFREYLAKGVPYEQKFTTQQAEIASNFTFVTFTAGVLACGSHVYDDPAFLPHYDRINQIAEQRFADTADYSRLNNTKAFLQIILPSLWLMITMCRDPAIRARSISILKSRHYQEGEFSSTVTANMAEAIVQLETQGIQAKTAWDIPPDRRICIEDIRYRAEVEEVVLTYTKETGSSDEHVKFIYRIPWHVDGDLQKFNSALGSLSQTCTLYRKVKPSLAPDGYIKPMYYKGELVPVISTAPP